MAAAAATAEIQALLRFLTQDAKIPLVNVLPKVAVLRKQGLTTPDIILKTDSTQLKDVFEDDKTVRQIVNAAKRRANPRKRAAPHVASDSASKQAKLNDASSTDSQANYDLPISEMSANELVSIEIKTNRAPLFLAFAITTLKYTMPEQPLSSRMSLAQAVVSANSQSKAKNIGLTSGDTAEEEGWAEGQPKVCILNREIAVLRRYIAPVAKEEDSQGTIKTEEEDLRTERADDEHSHNAFWGLDLEALRKSNGPLVAGKLAASYGPPIYRPESARAYLLKSMTVMDESSPVKVEGSERKQKVTKADIVTAKEKAAGMVLKALDLLFESWAPKLSREELDRKAWSWYVNVRPSVEQGQAGWGQKGTVRISDILRLRREA